MRNINIFNKGSRKRQTNEDNDHQSRETKCPRIKVDDSTITDDNMDGMEIDYDSTSLSPSPSPSCPSPSYSISSNNSQQQQLTSTSTTLSSNHIITSEVSNKLNRMSLESGCEAVEGVLGTTGNALSIAGTVIGGMSSVAQQFELFAPLISTFLNVGKEIIAIYGRAEHNRELCGLLLKRCNFAVAAVKDLDIRKTENSNFFSKPENFQLLKDFIDCMERIKNFISEVSQLNRLRRYIHANSVEEKFTKLVKEFENYMKDLNFSLNIQSRDELLIIKNGIRQIREILLYYGASDGKKFFDGVNSVTEKNRKFQEQIRQNKILDSSVTEILEETEPLLDGSKYKKTGMCASKRIEKRTYYENCDDVCFKEFPNNNNSDREETQIEIRRQVNILKELKNSDHIIRFYGVAEEDSKFYLVTEWMENRNLFEYYEKFKDSIDLKTKIEFALDVCRGVAYLHECKILHRDIQSANILVNGRKKVRIANFGLSRRFSDLTRNISQNLENIRYMAPEKLLSSINNENNENNNNTETKRKRVSYDSRCEIYSLGALSWEIAELRKPHSDLDKSEAIIGIRKRVNEKYSLPFSDDIPHEWKHTVSKAMEHDPNWRYKISDICRDFYRLSEQYLSPNVPPTITILSVEEAIREHKSPNGNKRLAWQSFQFYSETNIEAKYWLGYYYYHEEIPEIKLISKEERIRIALDIFKETADEGNPSAQLRYGMCLWKGEGVEANALEAIKYLEKAADLGNSAAMYLIGKAYWNGGNGIERDENKGAYYLKEAASKNHDRAKEMCINNDIK